MSDDPFGKPPQPDVAPAVQSGAWQPFTPKGVSAFARTSIARLLIWESLLALFAATVVVWFIHANYFPAIFEAVENMPDAAALENGELKNATSKMLTSKKFLSAVIDLESSGHTGQTADLQLEMRKDYFQICSLFGCGMFVYPNQTIYLGRSTAEPWLAARLPVIMALSFLTTVAALFLTWSLLAAFYGIIAKISAYFSDRELSITGSWKLASASQMPAAFLMSVAIIFYGIQAIDLIRFLIFFALHFWVAWIYLGLGIRSLPPVPTTVPPKSNPFSD